MDVYLTEKPRAKEWFADNIPGLYKLSKGEVLDDIDFINNNLNFTSNERASRFKRKAKLDDLETKRSNALRACPFPMARRTHPSSSIHRANAVSAPVKG
jgi:hypothetical protein